MRTAPLLVVGLLVGIAPCERPPEAPLALEVWNCVSWSSAHTCEVLDAGELVIVTPGQTSPLTVTGSVAILSSAAVDGVRTVKARVNASTTLHFRADGRVGTVDIVRIDPGSVRGRLAVGLNAEKHAEVEQLAAQVREHGTPEEQAFAVSALARVAVRTGRAAQAQVLFKDAVRRFVSLGLTGPAGRDLATVAWVEATRLAEPERARESLEAAGRLGGWIPDIELLIAFYEATWARDAADRRGILEATRTLLVRTEAGRAPDLRRYAMVNHAYNLDALGRVDEARKLLSEVRTQPELTACVRVTVDRLLVLQAWAALELEPGHREVGNAAMALADDMLAAPCWDFVIMGQASLDVAMLAQSMGDRARYAAARARLDRDGWDPRRYEFAAELDARDAIAAGRNDDAVRIYTETARQAAESGNVGAEWLATSGLARAHSLLGQADAALTAGARAHALAGTLIRRAPFGEGKQPYAVLLNRASHEHVERLLAAGRVELALQVARDVHARPLRDLALAAALTERVPGAVAALDEYRRLQAQLKEAMQGDTGRSLEDVQRQAPARARAQLEVDRSLDEALEKVAVEPAACEMTTTPSDEVLLVQHIGPHATHVFVERAGTVVVRRLDALAGLDGMDEVLSSARRVRVIEPVDAPTPLEHRAWRGRALAEQRPIVHVIDACARASRPTVKPPVTLVVDPSGNIPFIEEEVAAVTAASRRATRLSRESARARTVLDDIGAPGVDLFHYTGHAVHEGVDGWGAAMLLAEGDRIGVPDVLTLRRVPPWVVLSACESGGRHGRSAPLLGLGQAFVISGAEEVLVTNRKVMAKTTSRLMTALYAEMAGGHDLATALFIARRALAAEDPESSELLDAYQVLAR